MLELKEKWSDEKIKAKAIKVLDELSARAAFQDALEDMVGEEPLFEDAINVICQLSVKARMNLLEEIKEKLDS